MKTRAVERIYHLTTNHQNQNSKNASLSSTSAIVKVFLLLLMIFSTSKYCEAGPKRNRSLDKQQALPECTDEASVCGYVQLNNMGISSQPICRCKAGISCPLNWNPLDGRTVMHGNDQYKYCNRAPKLNLCNKEEIVYTTYLETSMVTMKTLINTNHIHCYCPAYHLFIRNNTKFHDLEDGTTIIGTSFQCKPPPRCELSDACLAITESAHSSFITRNCICPFGMFCPNDIRLASQRIDLDRGAYYVMNCI
jgi:hypothetical protein